MKWILVVLIGGVTPIQTDLQFEKLSECLNAEEQLRNTYAEAYEARDKFAATIMDGGVTIGEPGNFKNEVLLIRVPVFLMLERTSPWRQYVAANSKPELRLRSPRHSDVGTVCCAARECPDRC